MPVPTMPLNEFELQETLHMVRLQSIDRAEADLAQCRLPVAAEQRVQLPHLPLCILSETRSSRTTVRPASDSRRVGKL